MKKNAVQGETLQNEPSREAEKYRKEKRIIRKKKHVITRNAMKRRISVREKHSGETNTMLGPVKYHLSHVRLFAAPRHPAHEHVSSPRPVIPPMSETHLQTLCECHNACLCLQNTILLSDIQYIGPKMSR
jgi:hypothetical protein